MPPKAKRKAPATAAESDSENFSDESVEAPKKRSAKKAKKTPTGDRPARAKSAYQYFVAERTPALKGEQPDLKLAERSKVLGEEWRHLSEDEKLPYKEQSDADKASKRTAKEKAEDGKPKRPPTSYLIFTNAMRAQAKADNPDLKMTELSKVMGSMWRDLTDEEKRPYEEQAKAAKAKYDKDLAGFKKRKDSISEEPEEEEEEPEPEPKSDPEPEPEPEPEAAADEEEEEEEED
eukprot:TRINITY_DN14248_c1_g1_i1.p1 TRINITY_DN14248_c1_g1~~TRINITY_DN14248_c1_g1_i1.p1  ORF type:complete len:261 (+),score=87.59 TRINITY_DN14248_c1_g1_i1:84-785(+)